MSQYEVEVVLLESIAEINHLGCETYRPHYPHLWYSPEGIEWYLDKCFSEAQLALDLSNPSIHYYVIRVNNKAAGILKLVKNKAPLDWDAQECLYLEKIYFLKPYTGKGLGQKTMDWVFDQARQWQLNKVWLMAMDSSQKAIAGYQKAGFSFLANTRLDDEEFCRLKSELRGMIILGKHL
ncbi:GNAT family N-acetyltransferase [Runella slithyformis]|uniref:GCN5-related N-acetyltransferase n=1 Tax=Runella slithyformis (strain ATCC 29530 / DSM 19594 / LMG 11500 / NCIMB 11436 / LSU 4) TaxID=761193 RepID=A0A7U3ZNG1_RUNSL|nr:GNAT family N-acetyltransferase [Runella slithyformis]AEI50451.1 GCN5-related N-acetyltransferase [Runella slithyformis DSM 19594]